MSQATYKNIRTYINFYFIYSIYKEGGQSFFFNQKQPFLVKNLICLYENRWIAINIKSFKAFTQEIVYYKKPLSSFYGIHSLLLQNYSQSHLLIAMMYRNIKTFFLYQMPA